MKLNMVSVEKFKGVPFISFLLPIKHIGFK